MIEENPSSEGGGNSRVPGNGDGDVDREAALQHPSSDVGAPDVVPPGGAAPGGAGAQPSAPRLFGRLFGKLHEAVEATCELLVDGELRRKAVPFVLAEGSRAWQELQKGLSRNAVLLGRQLQNSAAGQFSAYVARLLDRTAYQPQRGRTMRYDGPVSVWIGSTVYRDMPQEIRTRLWLVLLEQPELVALLRPISSRTLLGGGVDPDACLSLSPLEAQQQQGQQAPQASLEAQQHQQQQHAVAQSDQSEHQPAPHILALQEAPALGQQPGGAQETSAAAGAADSAGVCTLGSSAAPQGQDVQAEAGPGRRQPLSGAHLEAVAACSTGARASASTEAEQEHQQAAGVAVPLQKAQQLEQQCDCPEPAALAEAPGEQQTATSPQLCSQQQQLPQAPAPVRGPADATITATTGSGAQHSFPAEPTTMAELSPPEGFMQEQQQVGEVEGAEHAAEDEVLSFLESKQPRQQPNASGNPPAHPAAAASVADSKGVGALRRALISKVASVVDKGKEVVAAARERAGSGGSRAEGVAACAGSATVGTEHLSLESGATALSPSSSSLLQQVTPFKAAYQAAGRPGATAAAGSAGGRAAALQVAPRTVAGSMGSVGSGSSVGAWAQGGVSAGGRAAAAQAALLGAGGDSEWELLDTRSASLELGPMSGYSGLGLGAGQAYACTDAAGGTGGLEDARSLVRQTLERHLREAHEASEASLEHVWSLMTSLPWEEGRGLVLDTPQDCRYLTLHEIKAGQEEVDDIILRDVHRTFPEHPMFQAQVGQQALFRLLKAYSLHDLEVGYCQGMAFAAGVILMYLPEEPAFRLYCQLMSDEGPNLRRLYLPGLEQLKAELARFEQLLQVTQPALQVHLEDFGIPPVLYVSQWLMTLYVSPFSSSFSAELIDLMVQGGHDAIMMRCALAIMDELAPALLRLHDFEQLLTYIKVTPMEWDAQHLQQLVSRAVRHMWCANAPLAEAAPHDATNAADPASPKDGATTDAGPTAAARDAASALGQGEGAAASAAVEGARRSEGRAGTGAGGSAAASGPSKLLEELLSGAAPHMIDAEELQLDQEIVQMVRELKLKVPQQEPVEH